MLVRCSETGSVVAEKIISHNPDPPEWQHGLDGARDGPSIPITLPYIIPSKHDCP